MQFRICSTKPRSAFTLVELLVVIGIIAMLISLLLPTLSRAVAQAQRVTCMANMRSTFSGMQEYGDDNRGWLFPSKLGTNVLWTEYPTRQRWPGLVFSTPNPAWMICPGDVDPGLNDVDPRDKHSYIVNKHLIYNETKFGAKGQAKVDWTQIVVMGEKKTYWIDYYMEVDNYGTPTAKSDYDRLVELSRHGLLLGSNLLFMDGHVSIDLPNPPPNAIDPWDPSGQAGRNGGG